MNDILAKINVRSFQELDSLLKTCLCLVDVLAIESSGFDDAMLHANKLYKTKTDFTLEDFVEFSETMGALYKIYDIALRFDDKCLKFLPAKHLKKVFDGFLDELRRLKSQKYFTEFKNNYLNLISKNRHIVLEK